MTQPVLGSLAWMTYSMAKVNSVSTLDNAGVLVNQLSDESGFINLTTEDGTSDLTVENPIFDPVRWI